MPVEVVCDSCQKRLQAAIPYFYPATATLGSDSTPDKDKLDVSVRFFSSQSNINNLDDLRKELNN